MSQIIGTYRVARHNTVCTAQFAYALSTAYWEHYCRPVVRRKLHATAQLTKPIIVEVSQQARKHIPAKAFPSSPEARGYDPHKINDLEHPFVVVESLFESRMEGTETLLPLDEAVDDDWIICSS